MTVVSAFFYQHFDDYVCDGHLFDRSSFTIGYKLMPNCFYFGEIIYFFFVR